MSVTPRQPSLCLNINLLAFSLLERKPLHIRNAVFCTVSDARTDFSGAGARTGIGAWPIGTFCRLWGGVPYFCSEGALGHFSGSGDFV